MSFHVRDKVDRTHSSRKEGKRSARAPSNVVAFPPQIARLRGRLDLQSVVRVTKPRAADLSTSQLAAARRAGLKTPAELDRFALVLARQEERRFEGRRADEKDEVYSFRRRYFEALSFARSLVLGLEELKPTAEGSPSDYLEELKELLEQVEAGMVRAQIGDQGEASKRRRNIGAVREALEWYRTASAAARKLVPNRNNKQRRLSGRPAYVPDVDRLRDYACHLAPALASIPTAAWARAVERWPGIERHGRGGGARICWYHVVYDLLKSGPGLTGAQSPQGLRDTWDDGATSKAKK
jgi:hypothetical protein